MYLNMKIAKKQIIIVACINFLSCIKTIINRSITKICDVPCQNGAFCLSNEIVSYGPNEKKVDFNFQMILLKLHAVMSLLWSLVYYVSFS